MEKPLLTKGPYLSPKRNNTVLWQTCCVLGIFVFAFLFVAFVVSNNSIGGAVALLIVASMVSVFIYYKELLKENYSGKR